MMSNPPFPSQDTGKSDIETRLQGLLESRDVKQANTTDDFYQTIENYHNTNICNYKFNKNEIT